MKLRAVTVQEAIIGFCVYFTHIVDNRSVASLLAAVRFAQKPFHSQELAQIFEDWADENIDDDRSYEVFDAMVVFVNKEDALMAYLAFK